MFGARIGCCVLLGLWASGGAWAQESKNGGHTFTLSRGATLTEPGNLSSASGTEATRRKLPKPEGPIVLDFDALPQTPWEPWDCLDGASKAKVANGVLTIDAVSCYEFDLRHSDPWHDYSSVWHDYVDNAKGWAIEARFKIDPVTADVPTQDFGAVMIWANDHTRLLIIGFNKQEIGIAYPEQIWVPMNTTDDLHTYRIESKLDHVKVYVDGRLAINHQLSWRFGGGSNVLMFGDGVIDSRSLSYWDYFSYDVSPHP